MGKRDRYELVNEDDPQFARFWNAYPKRVAKKDARAAWVQLKPDVGMVDKMVSALAWQVHQPDWLKHNGQYIPYPASYLRGRRFEDEPTCQAIRTMSDATAQVFAVLGVKP